MKSLLSKYKSLPLSKRLYYGFLALTIIATILVFIRAEQIKLESLEKEKQLLEKQRLEKLSEIQNSIVVPPGTGLRPKPTEEQLKNSKQFICFDDTSRLCKEISFLYPAVSKYCLFKNYEALSSECQKSITAPPLLYEEFLNVVKDTCAKDIETQCSFLPSDQPVLLLMCLMDTTISISSTCREKVDSINLTKLEPANSERFQRVVWCSRTFCKNDVSKFCPYINDTHRKLKAFCILSNIEQLSLSCAGCITSYGKTEAISEKPVKEE